MTATIEQTIETYGIDNWGAGYFGVNRKGNLIVHPPENDTSAADVKEIIDDLKKRGINAPVLLRFPQLLFGQIRKLQKAFKNSIKEFEYDGGHMCVYPMKVNQNRAVIEEYLKEGTRYNFGLEAGSKAELYAALALEQSEDSLLVLNGFKDDDFIQLAFAGAQAGKNVVIVIEKLSRARTHSENRRRSHTPKTRTPSCRWSACASSFIRKARANGKNRAAKRRNSV